MQLKKRILSGMAVGLVAVSSAVVTAPSSQAAINVKCRYTSSQATLSYGSYGTTVKQAQCELYFSMKNTDIAWDGSFGPATLALVKKFQGCAHLAVDGVIGPKTWSSLNYWSGSAYWAC